MFRSKSDPALHQPSALIARRISARKRRESIVTDVLDTRASVSGPAGNLDRSELLASLEEHSATTDGMVALHHAIERRKPDPWGYMGEIPSQVPVPAQYQDVNTSSPELLSRPALQQASLHSTLLQDTPLVQEEHPPGYSNLDSVLPDVFSEPICILTPKGRVVYLSSAFYLMQPQLRSGAYEVESFLKFLHPSDEAPLVAGLREVTQKGSGDFILRLVHHERLYEWFDFHGRLLIESNQKSILLHGRRRDPLERPLMQYVIHDQNQHQGPQLWFHLSRSGIILYATTTARSFFGLSDDADACYSLQEMYKTPTKERLLDVLGRVGVSERSICMDHDVRTKGGHSHKAHSTITMTAQRTLIAFIRLVKRGDGNLRPFKLHSWTDGTGEGSASGFSFEGPGSSNDDSGCVCTSSGNSMALDMPQWNAKQHDDWMQASTSAPALVTVYKLQQENRRLAEALQEMEQRRRKQQKKAQSRARGNRIGGCKFCHSTETPEWRRGPSGQRDLCNRCGLRWAKEQKERRKRGAGDSGMEE